VADVPATGGGLRAAQLASLLALESARRVQQLAKEGIIPKAKRGVYPPAAIPAYCRWLRESQQRRARNDRETTQSLAQERTLKVAAERRLAELELRRRERELAPVEQMDRQVEALADAVRREVTSLPARYALEIVGLQEPAEAKAFLERVSRTMLETLTARAQAMADGEEAA
jgi:hypothetical protein